MEGTFVVTVTENDSEDMPSKPAKKAWRQTTCPQPACIAAALSRTMPPCLRADAEGCR